MARNEVSSEYTDNFDTQPSIMGSVLGLHFKTCSLEPSDNYNTRDPVPNSLSPPIVYSKAVDRSRATLYELVSAETAEERVADRRR
jgi:hypothetical protein